MSHTGHHPIAELALSLLAESPGDEPLELGPLGTRPLEVELRALRGSDRAAAITSLTQLAVFVGDRGRSPLAARELLAAAARGAPSTGPSSHDERDPPPLSDEREAAAARSGGRAPLVPARDAMLWVLGDDVAPAVDLLRHCSLMLPMGELFTAERHGGRLVITGERGLAPGVTWDGRPIGPGDEDLEIALLERSAEITTLVLRRRESPLNAFLDPSLDGFEKIAKAACARAPAHWWFRPRVLELELTHVCNLRCSGCAVIDEVEAGLEGFDADSALALMTESADVGVYGVTLTGGEPFGRNELLRELVARSPLDIQKIQTNGKVFGSPKRAERLIGELAEAGLGARNRYTRPAIHCSIGMQTDAGTPIENVAHLTHAMRSILEDRVNLVLNFLVWDRADLEKWMSALQRAYEQTYGRRYPLDRVARMTRFEYHATPRLERLGLIPIARATVKERIEALPAGYRCQNFEREVVSALPKILVRADGRLYPCSCFGFARSPGSVAARGLRALLEEVNGDDLFRKVELGGLQALFREAESRDPEIANLVVPKTSTICKVCKAIREPNAPLFDPS